MPSTCGGRNDTQKDGERRSEVLKRWRSFCLHARLYGHVKEDLELRLETTHKHQEAGAAAQPAGSPSEPHHHPPPGSLELIWL